MSGGKRSSVSGASTDKDCVHGHSSFALECEWHRALEHHLPSSKLGDFRPIRPEDTYQAGHGRNAGPSSRVRCSYSRFRRFRRTVHAEGYTSYVKFESVDPRTQIEVPADDLDFLVVRGDPEHSYHNSIRFT